LWKILEAKIIELYPELVTLKDNDSTKAKLILAAKEAWELLEEDRYSTFTATGSWLMFALLKDIFVFARYFGSGSLP
jgi:hypothetical protein